MHTDQRNGQPLLEIQGLAKSYAGHSSQRRTVLDDLCLTLPAGIHALLGPNGAGKTTLVKILSTLLPYDAGEVRVLGLDPRRDRRELQTRISMTGQFAAVDAKLSCIENLEMMGELFGHPRHTAHARGVELLERFDLARSRDVRTAALSGGMRRKLDFAVGLISRPALVFLDEPTTGLDTRSRQVLWDEIRSLADAGTSILLTTQYLEEADALADQISVLHDGRIVAGGTADELKSLIGGAVIRVADETGSVIADVPTTGHTDDLAEKFRDVAVAHPGAMATIQRPTLDDVFLQLTEKAS
ncbi:MAG: ABC transporter ATP-binding protein [Mycobacteriaceae bacterium]